MSNSGLKIKKRQNTGYTRSKNKIINRLRFVKHAANVINTLILLIHQHISTFAGV